MGSIGLGPVLPAELRSLLSCDCSLRPVFEVHGAAVSIGRVSRSVPERLRRVVEHRDGGCRVPGCGRTWGLDVHHIWHWEDGGPTNTENVLCLCKAHHRQHHLKLLGIAGDADRPPGADGAVVFRDRHGRVLAPAGAPRAPDRTGEGGALDAARAAGADPEPGAYVHPDGNRIPSDAITLNPTRPPRPTRRTADPPAA